jgi:hypothetical protein
MTVAFPKLRVGDPLRHESLSVFPIFADDPGGIAYRLADEALADQSVLVEEISEGGSVPTLLVENKGDQQVLFLEGEELVGAKQNRILNTSVLIGAQTKVKIPVSCVEQGRWRYKSHYFGSSGSHSPSKLKRALKASVSRSIQANRGHASDQGAVWHEVKLLHAVFGVESPTSAMSDAFESFQDRITSYRQNLKYVAGAAGIAVAIGGRMVSVDLFDKPATCEKVWNRLLSGVVFDALEEEATEQIASVFDVEQLLAAMSDFGWQQAPAVGQGEEYRSETKRGDHASALVFDGVVVHGNVVVAA